MQSREINHIPVDIYAIPNSYDEQVEHLYKSIRDYNRTIERRDYHSTLDELFEGAAYCGFSFLNSNCNDVLFERTGMLEEKILALLNDERLLGVNEMRKEVIGKREDEIIRNIYNYSREHEYNQAILCIGSGHRKSMLGKIG